MSIRQLFRGLTSTCRRIAGFVVDIMYLLIALCIEIIDRFKSEE